MGRGDKKTKRGKIFKGSFGKLRPTKKATVVKTIKPETIQPEVTEAAPKKKAAVKKSK